jgi:uncharacterized protein (DUF1501 family)
MSKMNEKSTCCGPVSRRSILRAGALGSLGLSLPDLFRLRAEAGQPADDRAVLFVWLPGGAPHIDLYDLKPDAPAEIRSVYRPIPTKVAGMRISELLPRQAQVADRFALIRSMTHDFADHGGGHKRFMTGRIPNDPTGFVNDAPSVASIVSRIREKVEKGIPNVVALTDGGRDQVDTFSLGAAYLGPSHVPFMVGGDPSNASFKVRNLELGASSAPRLEDRLTLLRGFDQLRRDADRSGAMEAMDSFNKKAWALLTSDLTRKAFDLSLEKDEVRDRFGRHAFGQRALLGLRLIEAGVSFVTVVMENPGGPMPAEATYNWDSHAVNCHIFDDLAWRAAPYDQAVAALIAELYARGLDRRTMLIVTGEFGRTPRIEQQKGRPGRDHWPGANSLLVSGGGVKTGQVIGSTDKIGGYPVDRPVTPNDLWATVYKFLGIDQDATFDDHQGRPMHLLPFGAPIRELLG